MKRYHSEVERTRRAHQLHLDFVHSHSSIVDCVCEFQVGRFRKQKALGCGRPHCLLCHYEKILGIPSVSDRVREQRFLDSVEDYGEENDGETLCRRRSPTKPCS